MLVKRAAFGSNRHREEQSDVAIQSRRTGPSSLDCGSTQSNSV
jgi:hypothetical protein